MRDEEKHEWDRLSGESSKAYAHFCLYRDMGQGRSLRKMAKDGNCTAKGRQLDRWSSRWKWVERSQRYDDHLQYQDRLRQEKDRKDMLTRHGKIAVLGQNLVVKGIEKLLADVEQGKRDLSASDASRLLDVAVKIERLSRGEPTEISELGGSDEHPIKVNLEDRARQAVERALGITDRGPAERVETPEAADVPPIPDPLGNDTSRLAMMVKATQIGVSTATAGWAIFKRCLRIPNHLVILLSRSERQSLELARKCKGLIDAYEGIQAGLYEGRQFQRTEKKQHEIEFPNGSRIIALAANPDTARGYTGDMVLDEFAFHQDAEAIYKSAYGRMTNPGYQMRVVSTPNGAQGKFHALAQQMALDGGFRPPRQPVRLGPENWSAHWSDVHLAVEEGFPVNVAELRAGCDEDTWLQEYCCQFVAGGSQWIPWELFAANTEPGLMVDDNPQGSGLYAGWDVARNRDLSVVWFDERVGDLSVTRGVLIMSKLPTPDQTAMVAKIMPRVHRLCIDKTGMGVPIFETMDRMFPGRVEGITFTQQAKETMATQTKRRLEEHHCRLPETIIVTGRPDDQIVWQSFRSVRKTTTALGQVRFDVAHDEKYGHGDFYWAKCLAEAAAGQPVVHYGGVIGIVGRPITAGLMTEII